MERAPAARQAWKTVYVPSALRRFKARTLWFMWAVIDNCGHFFGITSHRPIPDAIPVPLRCYKRWGTNGAAMPTIDAVWVKLVAKRLERQGLSATELLRRAGVKPYVLNHKAARIPFYQHAAVLALAAKATENGC